MATAKLGVKGFIFLTLPHHCSSLRKSEQEPKQGRDLEVEADPEATGEEGGPVYWFAPHGLHSLYFYKS